MANKIAQDKRKFQGDDFKIYIQEEQVYDKNIVTKYTKLGLLCFNPGLAFDSLRMLKPRSIIVTSGTLAPLPSFENELRVKFAVKEEIKHLISSDQVNLSTLSFGIKTQYMFTHDSKKDKNQYFDTLADLG